MRLVALAAIVLGLAARSAGAEALPSGSLGILYGISSGTGRDANMVGTSLIASPIPSFHAAWQPMTTERRIGWALRGTMMFAFTCDVWICKPASAARLTELETMQMDATLGIRLRPGTSVRRFIAARGGLAVLRANQTIPPMDRRAFVGPVANVGVQQYFGGTSWLLDVDVRYGLIGDGPTSIALTVGLSLTGM